MRFLQTRRLTLACFLAAIGSIALASGRAKIPDGQVVAWTEKRVAEWQPKASERRFDEIGWAKDIRTALRLAQQHQRPVFIFTMDGRINIGRC
jgi:hypothetical protein